VNRGRQFEKFAKRSRIDSLLQVVNRLTLPRPSVHQFVGRDPEFYRIEAGLLNAHVVLLCGKSGIGKTALLSAFAEWWKSTGGLEKTDQVFYYAFAYIQNLDNFDKMINDIGSVGLGPNFTKLDAASRYNTFTKWLTEVGTLLILDQFEIVKFLQKEEVSKIYGLIHTIMSQNRSRLLIGSMDKEEWLGREIIRIEINPLSKMETRELSEYILAPRAKARVNINRDVFEKLISILNGDPRQLQDVLPLLEDRPIEKLIDEIENAKDVISSFPSETRRYLYVVSLFGRTVSCDILNRFCRQATTPERFSGVDESRWSEILESAAHSGLVTRIGDSSYWVPSFVANLLIERWRQEASSFAQEHHFARTAVSSTYAERSQWQYHETVPGIGVRNYLNEDEVAITNP
jgi:hypothetical protein